MLFLRRSYPFYLSFSLTFHFASYVSHFASQEKYVILDSFCVHTIFSFPSQQNKSFLLSLSFILFCIFSFCYLKFFRFNFSSYLKCLECMQTQREKFNFHIVWRPYERRVLLGLFERTCLFDTNIQFTPQRFPLSFFLLFFFWSQKVFRH